MSELLSLHIIKLHCYRQDEADGDEVFIKHNKKKVWPSNAKYVTMKEGNSDLDLIIPAIEPDTKIEIELWDYDFWSPNDLLGTFNFLMDKRGGPYKTDLKTDVTGELGKYALEWKIENA